MNSLYNLQPLTKIFFLMVHKAIITTIYGYKLVLGGLVRTFMVTIPTAFTPLCKVMLVPTKLFRTFIVPTPSQGTASKKFLQGCCLLIWSQELKKQLYMYIFNHTSLNPNVSTQ